MNMIKKIGFLAAFIIPGLVILGFYWGNYYNYLSILFVFAFIPIVDYLSGHDFKNVEDTKISQLSKAYYYQFVLYIWAFIQVGFLIWSFYAVINYPFSLSELIGFTVGVALVTGGVGITVAHELGHKKSTFERFLSQLLLMTVCYMHFYIEHNKGHHVNVSTPKDPATAREGEHFYAFWYRSVFGSIKSAWHLEKNRLQKVGLPIWSFQNKMIWFTILPIVFIAFSYVAFNYLFGHAAWQIIPYFFAQSILGFSLLEAVNYLEHYGLMRKQLPDGRYERVLPKHSWNNSHLISNFFLFQLQRHSDHHYNAIKRYQVLHHVDDAPQLPAGYPTMILAALVPPLWFSIMNPKLNAWKQKEKAETS